MLASASAGDVLLRARSAIEADVRRRKTSRNTSTVLQRQMKLDKVRRHLRDKANRDQDQERTGRQRSINIFEEDVDDIFMQLNVDIIEQRRLLKRQKQEAFDNIWGIDPTGEFYRSERKLFLCFGKPVNVEDSIKEELRYVRTQARVKYEKLRLATNVHTGTEILHCFIMDILGRNTSVAKVRRRS